MTLTLPDGETELDRWTISRRSFAWRCVILVALTALMLGPLVPVGRLWLWPVLAIGSALFYMWVFDEYRVWWDNRRIVWVLSDQAIYMHGPDAREPVDTRLALADISHVGRWPVWSIVLRLQTRQAITLPLVPNPRQVRAKISSALQNVKSAQEQTG